MQNIILIDLHTMQEATLPRDRKMIAALGNFDGVHLAHATLLHRTIDAAKSKRDASSAAWCFSSPSGDYLHKSPFRHLTTLEEKLRLFAANGIDYAYIADFPSLRDLSPTEFIHNILVARCGITGIVCGYNFHFGRHGAGSPLLLQEYFGEDAVIVPKAYTPLTKETGISSSSIRAMLEAGNVEQANLMLGYPYFLRAPILHGKQLGRTIGIPTINQIFPEKKLIPANGIYATVCIFPDGRIAYGVSNIGNRPTVEQNGTVNCETHLLDFHEDLYQKTVTVCFCSKLRNEKQFQCIDELKAEIQSDISNARRYFDSSKQSLSKQLELLI